MIGRADRAAGRPSHRPQVIDQQERVEVAETLDGKRPAHGKPAAFERAEGLNQPFDPAGLGGSS
jgi:hypothetical protein